MCDWHKQAFGIGETPADSGIADLRVKLAEAEADKALLDSGLIKLFMHNSLGEMSPCVFTQVDLRDAIRAAAPKATEPPPR